MGNEEGAFVEYYENGKIMRRIAFSNDQKNGDYEFFSPTGQLAFSLSYEEDIAIAVKYRNAQGKMLTQSLAKVDETFTAYYPNAKPAGKIAVKNNCLNGRILVYDENGKTMYDRSYKDNYVEGTTAFYYSNGKLRESYSNENDEREGEATLYSPAGMKIEEGNYKAGMKTGIWKYFDNKGNVKYSVLYKNGREIDLL
jgi:antitoxin component YwqK of YwqJK toxin-antitoxin module